MYLSGEPVDIVLDDYIPCFDNDQQPCFTKTKGPEIWVPIIEKAYAKLNGSYDNIIAGICSQALSSLTGAPCSNFVHKYTPNIIDLIHEGEQKNFIMCTGSNSVPNKWEDIS